MSSEEKRCVERARPVPGREVQKRKRPLASLSLDLDNQWSYMKIHGDAGWEEYPSYLDLFVPRVLELLSTWNLRITFFVVGVDARMGANRAQLKAITDHGHEVGNHSMHHESWLQQYSRDRLYREVCEAEEWIAAATGRQPVGFRGPGFSWSAALLALLAERRYLFDASTLPTYIGPLARLYYFWKSDLSREEKNDRRELFGGVRNGFQPLKPFLWRLPSGKTILEMPVTTIPVIKTPFHLSYLLYLSRQSTLLMRLYLSLAIAMCEITGMAPSFLLHPLDLIGGDQLRELAFFPGMDIPSDRKAEIFHIVIGMLSRHFKIVGMGAHARHLLEKPKLKTVPV